MRLRECKVGMDVELLRDIYISSGQTIPETSYGKISAIYSNNKRAWIEVDFGGISAEVSHLIVSKPRGLKDKPCKVKNWLPMPRKFIVTYRSGDAYGMMTIEADTAIQAGILSFLPPECIIGINKIN